MSNLPSMPLYVDDYEADTAHLSVEEDGAYMRLLRLCWRSPQCQIPDESDWIQRRMRIDSAFFDRVVAPLLDEFFSREKGMVWQKRQRQEYAFISAVVLRRKEAGSRGGKAKALKRKDIDPSKAKVLLVAKGKQTPSKTLAPTPTPTPTPTSIEESASHSCAKPILQSRFIEFWEGYPRRNGARKGRAQAEIKFNAAVKSGTDPQIIIDAAIAFQRDRQAIDNFAPDPAAWLHQRKWLDEIERPPDRINGFRADPPSPKIRPRPPEEPDHDTTH